MAWTPLLARWLTPTEGTSLGDTLWLTALTFLVATIVTWVRTRANDSFRFDRLDIAVCLLCGAHVLSAMWVVATDGQKRAATNMLWEWTAIAVQFLLIRASLIGPLKTVFLRVFVALWVAQAGFGIWQHFIWYPATVQQYEQKQNELKELESGASGLQGIDLEYRLREVRAWFVEQGIPMTGPGRLQFEGRLKDSADPVGFFALTNTFAGFLAVLIVLLWSVVLSQWRSKPALITTVALAALTAWCLLLTKSRTAMCGAVAGLVITTLVAQLQSKSGVQLRRILLAVIVIPVVAGALFGAVLVSGGMDSDMLSDAPKSLQYRLYYWSATARVIADHPLLGTGPGNFRDAYLQHKIPESSEEIADPHNFVLDVTANAGLIGFLALGALLVLVVMSAARTVTASEEPVPEDATATDHLLGPVAIAAGGLVVIAWTWLIEARLDLRIACVCGVACLLARILASRNIASLTNQIPIAGIAGGMTGLLVHLLGAGGMAMPAVAGLLLALVALTASRESTSSEPADSAVTTRSPVGTACMITAAAAFAGCAATALLPGLNATASLQRGDYEVISRGNADSATREYHLAAEADSLSPEPYLRLASLKRQQFEATRSTKHLLESIEFLKSALNRSSHSASIRRELGQRYLLLGMKESDTAQQTQSLTTAIDWYQQALERYPSNCQWTAEYAELLSQSGDQSQAVEVARRALALDDMNEELAHYDRVLSDELRDSIEAIAN